MTPERWIRLQSIFHQAEVLPPEQGEAFIASQCRDDPALGKHVLSLLATAADPDFLSRPIGKLAAELAPEQLSSGGRVGAYRIIAELGRGGMGSVYLAERADQGFKQTVALKIVGGILASPAMIERFLSERRILAQLDHPNIARLLDGGATDQGTPYFVMERVEGEPVNAYCDRRQLSISSRLNLFLSICDAVQHAHRNLVIHRDLKPSNILVTDDGTPKLLDFGIAKLLGPGSEAAAQTRLGELPMTPEYASPEQVQGQPVSVASDVYALGLLLYELLTGQRAQRLTSHARSEVERAICDTPPTRPSSLVTRTPVDNSEQNERSVANLAAARNSTPRSLQQRLKGDLDTIVLTALNKEPERRYLSVEAFARDVKHHLGGQPVEARGNGFGYRAWKFIKRNRLGVATAAALAAGLTVSTLIASYGLIEARREAQVATEISDFLEEVFRSSDPGQSRGESVTVREVLDAAVARLEEQSTHDPMIDVRLRRTLGSVYKNLGLLETGEVILEQAAARADAQLGPSHEETLLTRTELGFTLWRRGRYPEAEQLLHQTFERSRAALGADASLTLTAANGLGLAVWRQSRFGEAEAIFEDTLDRRVRLYGVDHPETLSVINNLAGVHLMRWELADAASLYRQAWNAGRRVRGPDHPASLDSLNNLAMVHEMQGQLSQARDRFKQLVTLRQRVLGDRHPRTLSGMAKLGNVLRQLGALNEAESLLHSTLAAQEEALGPDHADTLFTRAFLSHVYLARSNLDAAGQLYGDVLAERRRVLGEDHHDTLQSLRDLGELHQAAGRLAEAEALYRDVLERYQRVTGEDGYWTVTTLADLGTVALRRSRTEKALALLADARERADRAFPNDARLRGTVLLREGQALFAANQVATAKQRFEEASILLSGDPQSEALAYLERAGGNAGKF